VEVRKHKVSAWKSFAGQLNENPWARAFKWAKSGNRIPKTTSTLTKEDGSQTSNCLETAELILDRFIPPDPTQGNLVYHGPLNLKETLESESIKAAIWRIRPSRAPGADGITAGMLRKAWPALKDIITELFGRCIGEGVFPRSWKAARLVLIPKPGNLDTCQVKSFRPISLLPVLGKALETIIIESLNSETNIDEYSEQHGFTAGKSTITALEKVFEWIDASKSRHVFGTFLDITGAFDNMKWAPMFEQLKNLSASLRTLRLVHSYLENISASLEIEGQ